MHKIKNTLFLFDDYSNLCNGIFEIYKQSKRYFGNNIFKLNIKSFYIRSKSKNIFSIELKDLIQKKNIKNIIFTFPPWLYLSNKEINLINSTQNSILFVDDCEEYFEWFQLPFAKLCNKIMCHDYKDIAKFEAYNLEAFFFPQISLLTSILKDNNKKFKDRTLDFFFIGRSDRQNRLIEISKFNEISNNYFFKYSDLEKSRTSNFEKLILIKKSKIFINFSSSSLNQSYFSSYKKNLESKNLKGRVFEGVLNRSLVITENSPGINEVFGKNNGLIIFNSFSDLLDKIKYYLENPKISQYLINKNYDSFSKYISKEFYYYNLLKFNQKSKEIDISLDTKYRKYLYSYLIKERIKLIIKFFHKKKYHRIFEELFLILKNFDYNFIFYLFKFVFIKFFNSNEKK